MSSPRDDTVPAPVPPSLLEADLAAVWDLVATRLEQRGEQWRGTAQIAELSPRAQHVLTSLLGRRASRRIPLDELEAALVARGVADDLSAALARLGRPVSATPERRRAARATATEARAATAALVEEWGEPWAAQWWTDVVSTGALRGMDVESATRFVGTVRSVIDELDRLAGPGSSSRTDLAARVLGDSHALDTGSRLNAALVRYFAARHADGRTSPHDHPSDGRSNDAPPSTDRDWWESVGAPTDLVSAPVLTWRLPLSGPGPAHAMARAATSAGLPLHLSQLALRQDPAIVPSGTTIYSVENPRLVEAAAQRRLPVALLCTNGSPATAVTLLVRQLLDCGASVLHHGDFDAAGLAITARLCRLGAGTWHMGAADYVAAVRAAEEQLVELPRSGADAPATPWDPPLQAEFDARRRVVHEERLMDQLFDDIGRPS